MSTQPQSREPARERRALTLRAFLIGIALTVATGVAGPYWTLYLQTSRLWADYHTAGATFFLFALLLVFNFGLGRLWRGFALRAGELMVVGAMLLVGGSIVTSGLVAYFIPAITSVYYRATPSNDWNTLWDDLPSWASPLDPNGGHVAIKKFWEGLPKGEPIPWEPWMRPLLLWGVFLLALFICLIAVMVLMRKQWVEYEHLSFPIAQVPAELCAAAGPRSGGSILHSGVFWLGVGTTFLLASTGGISHYLGGEWFFRVRHTVQLAPGPWQLHLYLDLVVIGLVFLIPNRIAFSVWFMALAGWVFRNTMQTYQLALPNGWLYGNETQHMGMGAAIIFVVSSLWLSRGHLKRVLRCALGVGDRDYDQSEPASYRTALLAIVLSLAVTVAWLRTAGLRWHLAALLILATVAIYYTMARVVAQCGVPAMSPPIYPHLFVTSVFGTANLTAADEAVFGMHFGWHFDMRNSPMSGSAHGMYLTRGRRGGLFWAMVAALVVAYVTACLTAVWVSYRHAGVNMDGWFFGNYPSVPWTWTRMAATNIDDPSFARMVWAGVGALIMAGLTLAQRTFFWWPLHPVGMLVASSHMVYFFWASVFAAWLVKALLVWASGYSLYRQARRFMIGMVMGFFLAGGTWALVDTLTQSTGNSVFYI
ncbi:MAG: DUF6785 family protein [Planctomycetota bacterium]